MLNQIALRDRSSKPESALELLISCHDRIRHFTSSISKLAHSEGSELSEISTAAGAAHRYFTVALPLHEADEEESLRPRLLESGAAEISAALDAMGHQHQAIDDLIERLLPLLILLSNNPAKLPEVHGELCTIAKALSEVFSGHLQLEELVIFPALTDSLSAEAQAEVLVEMRERRKQG
jgi:iron-sulfur cluster repair protein YtfE (RIC family)